jgi:hypothetical protein
VKKETNAEKDKLLVGYIKEENPSVEITVHVVTERHIVYSERLPTKYFLLCFKRALSCVSLG